MPDPPDTRLGHELLTDDSSLSRTRPGPLQPSPLEDILLEEGVLSPEHWVRIKAAEEQQLAQQPDAIELGGSPRWYHRLRLYGFAEMRFNRLGQPNGNYISWDDPSVGKRLGDKEPFDPAEPGGFFFRRVRLVVAGQVSDRVSIYLQPEMAAGLDGQTNVVVLRDAWAQYALDARKEWRIRAGIQKMPCSFDSWQSSNIRVAIDRADATNTCMPNQRDLGISLLYTPQIAQYRWKQMVDYLHGAGDHGMINLTVSNGQGSGLAERNANKHLSLRLAYPFELWGGRLLELGLNAMTGRYSVDHGLPSNTSLRLFSLTQDNTFERRDYDDKRVNFYMYYPPQPFGVLAEYAFGMSPMRNPGGIVEDSRFSGGYVQLQYQWKYTDTATADFFARWQTYDGGLKFAPGAPNVSSREWEFGVAWLPDPQWRLTFSYSFAQRMNFERTRDLATFTSALPCDATFNLPDGITPPTTNVGCVPGEQFAAKANVFRIQLQWFFN
jgi:hypothetical protein